MRIAIIAYACRPDAGSEPGAGWTIASAAAEGNQVWLFTEAGNIPRLQPALAELDAEIHLVATGPSLPDRLSRTPGGRRVHSMLWQLLARRALRGMHKSIDFDVVHHVSYGSDWAPTCATALDGVPFVWGPVGGYSASTLRLGAFLNRRGLFQEALRSAGTSAMRAVFGRRVARRADLCIAQNVDVARKIRKVNDRVVVHPNVAVRERDNAAESPGRREHVVGFAGNLLRLKGLGVLVDALSQPPLAGWTLELAGDGPDRSWVVARAAALGVADRVVFLGRLPHDAVYDWLPTLSVFAFPSFRDSAGWALAEAVMTGVPVVCLDRGGPPTITSGQGVISTEPTVSLALRLAEAIADGGCAAPKVWSADRFPNLVKGWYETARSHEGKRVSF
jgi:glycosyltransferase involved in cell wall biosynthesis